MYRWLQKLGSEIRKGNRESRRWSPDLRNGETKLTTYAKSYFNWPRSNEGHTHT